MNLHAPLSKDLAHILLTQSTGRARSPHAPDYTDMPCQSTEETQVMVLNTIVFDHCDLKKEDGKLRRQKVSNINSAAAVR